MGFHKQPLIALDQFCNTLVPPWDDAWADETFSARCWRKRDERFFGAMRRVVDFLALVIFRQRGHCQDAFEGERGHINLPGEER